LVLKRVWWRETLRVETAELNGAGWLRNVLNPLLTPNCSELNSDAAAAFGEVLHSPELFRGFVVVVWLNMSAKTSRND